ncbi:MAG: type V CRISPR-associated protein Cas4 [Alphaproteobacteria bacterium]|nr:type V CRISPR-associated protein Cas4 [Alphaproteobacteria bacterium]
MSEENSILISQLNDFVFCPVSIYFHALYGNLDKTLYQGAAQIDGTHAHQAIDNKRYSSRKNVLQGIDVYSDELNIRGKIDVFDVDSGVLTERKNKIVRIYDGYVFQLYAQYYALTEMGYTVKKIRFHSMSDNKNYDIKLPSEDTEMDKKFKSVIKAMKEFNMESFHQTNIEKCRNCIYYPACDRSLYVD